ncbi:MAG: DNA polymerase II [Treponema sp.]|jgi:DNA polymerase-2|nr:DNA polymerase II [Treponema sp.]
MEKIICRGFIIHAYADKRRNQIYLLGRLEDGRSFASAHTRWRPSLHIYEKHLESARKLLSRFQYEVKPAEIESFEEGEKLLELKFQKFFDRASASSFLEEAGIPSPDGDHKPADAFLIEHGLKGAVQIKGEARTGRLVDLVFAEPELSACAGFSPLKVPIRLCSVDIETDVKTGTILAVGFSVAPWSNIKNKRSMVHIISALPNSASPYSDSVENSPKIIFHSDEKSLLKAFLLDMQEADPDVLTGWNFLDFDYPRLAERFGIHNIPFTLGRSREEAKFFPSAFQSGASHGDSSDSPWHDRRHSAAALVPGRQVIDALRVVRSGPRRYPNYTLETVAQAVLGESKTVASIGEQKIKDLEKLYSDDPVMFAEYCMRDAELVLEILDRTGLFRLTIERASLTGVFLDKAWTSVVSFERVYGMELWQRKIAPPPKTPDRKVSGAAGGTVLEPLPGFFANVGVFDFRSLYPTIMLTFNIDPRAYALSSVMAETEANEVIKAPNGAAFSREPGILPELIASYFAARRKALDEGDEEASHVYKILMNSFYGVLGTPSCRYGKSELAGAITSFARKWLLFSRSLFIEKGYKVLYGDTDSLFVESGLTDESSYGAFVEWGNTLARELNLSISKTIEAEYKLKSFVELRFEKPYRRFMIPPLRNLQGGEGRGRAKGYGGWLLDSRGGLRTEVKGMEAVRSDSTPLARRIQLELLELVFKGGGEKELQAHVLETLNGLRRGLLDNELIYRKRLSRAPEEYTASTPPQVKAARALGWKNRRGTVEYVWTISGPEPIAIPHSPPDYDHYTDTQVLSVARSISAAAGWNRDFFPHSKKDHLSDAQIEMDF